MICEAGSGVSHVKMWPERGFFQILTTSLTINVERHGIVFMV